MSGLLRSLGAQALDRVPALRPAARLRGAEMLWAKQERDRASASETFGDAPLEARSPRTTAKPASSARPVPARPALDDDAAREIVPGKRAATMIATGNTMSVRGPIVRSRTADDRQRRTLVPPDEDDTADERARRNEPPERRAAVTTTSTSAKPARRHDHRARPDDPAAFARPTREPAVPDVQIHIGRIELTAVTAPASAPRAAPAGRKPMSLDDYLRERTRKTR